jgi:succinate dehydrogenase/fumarate reductase-like Fe-S protein
MSEHSVGQILQAFNSIKSTLQDQNEMIRELTVKVSLLEKQNKKMEQLIYQQKSPPNNGITKKNHEFQEKVTQSLRCIEDSSKKAIDLIKENNNGRKKRAWP